MTDSYNDKVAGGGSPRRMGASDFPPSPLGDRESPQVSRGADESPRIIGKRVAWVAVEEDGPPQGEPLFPNPAQFLRRPPIFATPSLRDPVLPERGYASDAAPFAFLAARLRAISLKTALR